MARAGAFGSGEVAVVVPVLNEARLVGTLAPALERLSAEAEVIVVDGASADGTRARLSEAATGLRVIGAPRGRAAQMNAGARATSAPILLFLHADTRLPDGALARVKEAVRAGAVGGCFRLRIDSRDPRLRLAARLINLRSRLLASATGDQAIFVTRAAFERSGGYPEVALLEDLGLVRRLRALGRFQLLDACVETSARRWHAHGVARTIALMWTLRVGYHLGIDPATLHRLYGDPR